MEKEQKPRRPRIGETRGSANYEGSSEKYEKVNYSRRNDSDYNFNNRRPYNNENRTNTSYYNRRNDTYQGNNYCLLYTSPSPRDCS